MLDTHSAQLADKQVFMQSILNIKIFLIAALKTHK